MAGVVVWLRHACGVAHGGQDPDAIDNRKIDMNSLFLRNAVISKKEKGCR